jgi:aspartate aminotransferase-like enzyme
MPTESREPKKDLRQTTFLEGVEPVATPKNGRATASINKAAVANQALRTALSEALAPLAERLGSIQAAVAALVEQVAAKELVKEYYTVAEIAAKLEKSSYTVREWCRLQRINAEKANFGHGLDQEWRISHAELVRIQNEGLLAAPSESRIEAPRRLKKRQAS